MGTQENRLEILKRFRNSGTLSRPKGDANHRLHRLPKRRQSAAHCSTDNAAKCVKLFYQAGDISHQPPTPRPNTHTANPFATSRSGLRYRWKSRFQDIVLTGNLLLQNAPPLAFKLGPFRGPRVHFEAKGAKRENTQIWH